MDADRLGELIDQHAAALELYAAQWTGAPEDCVQEAFIELVRQAEPPQNVTGWLYRVVRNRALNAGRSERRRERHEQLAAETLQDRLAACRPADLVEAREVAEALVQLDDAQREVVILRVWSDLTLEEAARLLDCSTSTVHRRYTQALETLRTLLEAKECPKTTRCP